VIQPTLDNIHKLFFETSYPRWLWNTMLVSTVATFLSLFCSVFAAYAIERLRFKGARITGMVIFLAYLVPPSILFIPLATMVFAYGIFDTPAGAHPHLSDVPHPVLHLAADGLFPHHPLRAGGMRPDRRGVALANSRQNHAAARRAGAHLGRHLRLHIVVERVHLRADLHLVLDGAGRRDRRTRRCRSA
jgi:hypothetical protein